MHNFAAYLDLAVQIQPTLYLVGGVYNFEVTDGVDIRFNSILCSKPYMGVMQIADQTPYLFFLLKTQEPLPSFDSAEVSFHQNEKVIYWRMVGAGLLSSTKHPEARAHIQGYPENMRKELDALMKQHLAYYQASEYETALRTLMTFS